MCSRYVRLPLVFHDSLMHLEGRIFREHMEAMACADLASLMVSACFVPCTPVIRRHANIRVISCMAIDHVEFNKLFLSFWRSAILEAVVCPLSSQNCPVIVHHTCRLFGFPGLRCVEQSYPDAVEGTQDITSRRQARPRDLPRSRRGSRLSGD